MSTSAENGIGNRLDGGLDPNIAPDIDAIAAPNIAELAFEELPAPAVVVERQSTRIEDANRAARRLLGLDPASELPLLADLVTRPVGDLIDDLRIAAGGTELPLVLVGDAGGRDGDQSTIRKSCRVVPIAAANGGRPTHWLVMVCDRAAGLESFRSLNRRLQDANKVAGRERLLRRQLSEDYETLERFAHAMAHDLKGPLRHIGALLPVIESGLGDDLPSEMRGLLGAVQQSATRGRDLIDSLLAHAGAASGPLDLRSVDLDRLIEDLVAARRFELDDIEHRISVGRPLGRVQADPALLHLLVDNLIGNAIKYRHPDRPLSIEISGRADDGTILAVADNGIGVDPADAAVIFEPFKRLATGVEGHGIGLATCRVVCRRHGWSIEVSGQSGEGTRFLITSS